jgi:hypothetical protein
MPGLPMTFACGLYDRVLALQTGDLKPDGIDLNFLVMDNPREIFDRMSNRLEFDACEMSSSEYVSRLAAKKLPFVALPVFASRVFRHGFIVVNRRFITSAKDLAGKRIGVPLYTQTAAIFIRGLMQHDLGIDLRRSNPVFRIQFLDCFAELVIGPATSGRTRWLTITGLTLVCGMIGVIGGRRQRDDCQRAQRNRGEACERYVGEIP